MKKLHHKCLGRFIIEFSFYVNFTSKYFLEFLVILIIVLLILQESKTSIEELRCSGISEEFTQAHHSHEHNENRHGENEHDSRENI